MTRALVFAILAMPMAIALAQQNKVDPLGVAFVESRKEARIAEVLPGSPAAIRGLRAEDIITAIDGVSTGADYMAVILLCGTGGPQDEDGASAYFLRACEVNGAHSHCG
jgi:S1-C subfamily serine protease